MQLGDQMAACSDTLKMNGLLRMAYMVGATNWHRTVTDWLCHSVPLHVELWPSQAALI
jgi:hypothetical protein